MYVQRRIRQRPRQLPELVHRPNRSLSAPKGRKSSRHSAIFYADGCTYLAGAVLYDAAGPGQKRSRPVSATRLNARKRSKHIPVF